MRRQYFRPILSESFPKSGHAKNANRPFAVSIIPTAAYVHDPNFVTSIPGIIDLVMLSAKYS